jgi:hypothetical protein
LIPNKASSSCAKASASINMRIFFFGYVLYCIIFRILVGKPEGKRPLGRPRRRWVDNIKMDLREIGWDGEDWMAMAQERDQWRALVNTVLNLRVP